MNTTPLPRSRPVLPFVERHRVISSLLTLALLLVTGFAVGGLLGRLLADLVELAIAQVGGGP